MANPTLGRVQKPLSYFHARSSGFTNPRQIALLAKNLTREYYSFKDEFDGLAVGSQPYWGVANTGVGAASPVKSSTLGIPTCIFTTGGGNPGVSTLHGAAAVHLSQDNPFIYARFRWPANVTAFYFELGLVNIATTKTTQVVSALTAAAVPTVANGLTNGVVFCMDTAFTLTTPALVGIGTSTAVAGVKATQQRTTTAYTPTAAKWVDFYLQATVGGGICEVWEDDAFINRWTVDSGPDTAVSLFPYILFGDHGTSKVVHLDVAEIIEERNIR